MSCICSLESCCFDKVKPVRDTVLQVLHRWRCFPRPDTPEPSEAGSSSKENFCAGDYGDIFSVNESGCKDVMLTKVGFDSIKKRTPLSTRKACQDFVENSKHSKENCWHIEIAVPGTHNVSSVDVRNEESGVSSITKTFERMIAINTSPQDVGYEYMPIDDRQECSSVSNLVTDNSQTKFVMVSDDCLEEGGMVKSMGINQRFADVEISILKMRDGRSLDSTLTESGSQTMHGCCLQTGNEMVFTRKQLLEIQNKQSNLMDLLKVFTTSTMDSLSMIQLKVSGLGHIVDRIAQDLVQGGRYSDLVTAKFLKKITSIASPRLSTSTPRPSVDIRDRQPALLSMKNTEHFGNLLPGTPIYKFDNPLVAAGGGSDYYPWTELPYSFRKSKERILAVKMEFSKPAERRFVTAASNKIAPNLGKMLRIRSIIEAWVLMPEDLLILSMNLCTKVVSRFRLMMLHWDPFILAFQGEG
ncbi:hypothetical protein F0562_009173 [Nyssa sinensis]|uniref:Uncharacterized protein n=1 Tax=Nyssa sinensis TaxID=561372 RepID=A0A5J4ZV93_9ASTE|nr:hypothetical protein F0562_009173 [Nyssa sinensis]